MKDLLRKLKSDVSRRQAASALARSCLGVSLLPMLGHRRANAAISKNSTEGVAPGGKADRIIYLYMAGGMTHIDTFDPKPGAETNGPTEAIKTKTPGLRVGSHLTKIAQHSDKIAVINSMYTTTGDHEGGRYYMHTAYPMRGSIRHPAVGSWLVKLDGQKNEVLPPNVLIGGGSGEASSGFLETRYAPLPLANARQGLPNSRMRVSEEEFRNRLELADAFDKPFRNEYKQKQVRAYTNLYADAIKLMKSKDLEIFDITKEPQKLQDDYGANGFGQGCLLARRLIENDVRAVEVVMGGWDTHTNNFTAMDNQLPTLDQALGALLEDLRSKGLLDNTLVVLATEFGRTPRINPNNGRDHYPAAFSCMVAGGGIKGGQVYGKTNAEGTQPIEDKVSVPDFNATIGHALGLDLDKVVHSRSGRPFTFANKGKPIAALF